MLQSFWHMFVMGLILKTRNKAVTIYVTADIVTFKAL